jgi:two-component system sensor histidine kinase CpxA
VKADKRFLSQVSHELRSPLGRMQAAVGLLERRLKGQELGWLADLKEEIERMSAFTGELLALAQLELQTEPLELVPTRVADAVAEAIHGVEHDPAFHVDIPAGLMVRAHPEYLTRAIRNVIRQAARHAGPIEITARASDGTAVISVADSGPAMGDDALARLFEPFCRTDSSRDIGSGGLGLDLAVARSCVKACGGSIDAARPDGAGLIVCLRLPRVGL